MLVWEWHRERQLVKQENHQAPGISSCSAARTRGGPFSRVDAVSVHCQLRQGSEETCPSQTAASLPPCAPFLQVLLNEEREAMAKSRRLERSAGSFSYSSYHTLEEVGLLHQALASVFRS